MNIPLDGLTTYQKACQFVNGVNRDDTENFIIEVKYNGKLKPNLVLRHRDKFVDLTSYLPSDPNNTEENPLSTARESLSWGDAMIGRGSFCSGLDSYIKSMGGGRRLVYKEIK